MSNQKTRPDMPDDSNNTIHQSTSAVTPERAISSIAQIEEKILAFWQENKIFEKSLEKNKENGEPFVFYDGPPFATGLPHYGHILPGTMKDIMPRYQTMRGRYVPRTWGWDCHGLPIENLIEKELGVKNKSEIEALGIDVFTEAARKSVLRYESEWKRIIPRLGRWIDMDRAYKTMDPEFTESVWWGFNEFYKKDLAYEGFQSMHYCPRCETTLSNFEVNQGYKDITDISVYVPFLIVDGGEKFQDTSILAWTTTPWTLPGNVALAVSEKDTYVKFTHEDKHYIVAKDLFASVMDHAEDTNSIEILEEFSGSDLVGLSYMPPFDYYSSKEDLEDRENGWKVYAADFVTMEDGTGIVHVAPAFGDDDYTLLRKHKLPFVQHVTGEGKFTKDVIDFAGQYVKPKDDHMKTDIEIIKCLAGEELLFKKKKLIHSYPHCWRCDTPLLNYATSSWFIGVSHFKDELVEANNKIHWVPEKIGSARFGNWLEGAKDWGISRSRYWGAPLPVWKGDKGTVEVFGSYDELAQKIPAKNKYIGLRHGESVANTRGTISAILDGEGDQMTDLGREQSQIVAEEIRDKGIDLIIYSPFTRTQETAKIIAAELGLSSEKVIADETIQEIQVAAEAKSWQEWVPKMADRFLPHEDGSESYRDVKTRATKFLYDCEEKFEGKTILIVTHGLVLDMFEATVCRKSGSGVIQYMEDRETFFCNAEWREFDFRPLPHNEEYDFDIHRPFIDSVTWTADDGEVFTRIESVFDTWVDSGSMPHASKHYPFAQQSAEAKKDFEKTYQADFIAEGLDQTRGWFYTLLVQSVGLFEKASYKNVVVNGMILAEDGRKMSKSLKNYPDLEPTVDQYGSDALRYFLVASPGVKAEAVNFSEKGVDEVMKKLIMRLYNVVSFYEMHRDERVDKNSSTLTEVDTQNTTDLPALDQWIIARLDEVRTETTNALDEYLFDRAARPLVDFVDDLSTWYIRRSRDRFKEDNEEREIALKTTRYILAEFAKVLAPFTPFTAEEVYLRVRGDQDPESIHLTDWTLDREAQTEVLETMRVLREVVTEALQKRSKSQMKIKQPLQSVTITDVRLEGKTEYLEILEDELNVKEVFVDPKAEEVTLDLNLTPELITEGHAREFIRGVQGKRKSDGLIPEDEITILFAGEAPDFVVIHQDEIFKTVGATGISEGGTTEDIKIGEEIVRFGIQKN